MTAPRNLFFFICRQLHLHRNHRIRCRRRRRTDTPRPHRRTSGAADTGDDDQTHRSPHAYEHVQLRLSRDGRLRRKAHVRPSSHQQAMAVCRSYRPDGSGVQTRDRSGATNAKTTGDRRGRPVDLDRRSGSRVGYNTDRLLRVQLRCCPVRCSCRRPERRHQQSSRKCALTVSP